MSNMAADDFAKVRSDKTAPSAAKMAPNHLALVNKIKELFPRDTVKALAAWLKVHVDTARHRIKGNREFSLDEIVTLLHDQHGYQILKALMERAERKPRWWTLCEPLMELADLELMTAEARRRTRNIVHKREQVIDALETEIRRAQARAVQDAEHAGPHLEALAAMVRMVAAKG